MSKVVRPEPENDVARCRRVREQRDRRFKTIEAALAHFAALERQGARSRPMDPIHRNKAARG